ncbi:MAG TPA: serine hydrolase, partial [Longimicrobiales bacterium]
EEAGRRGHLQGDVDDANGWALDGVAGHAGLFSSVRDMAHFARVVLAATEGEDTEVLDGGVIRSFAADRPDGRRALGWDGAGSSSWGHYFSPVSFGHNGYTGTSIWIDPERDLYVVLLTNRVDPSARNERHLVLRRQLSAAVRDASPILMAESKAAPAEASVFAAQVAAARTIFRAPVESIRRIARHHLSSRHHATRRATARAGRRSGGRPSAARAHSSGRSHVSHGASRRHRSTHKRR